MVVRVCCKLPLFKITCGGRGRVGWGGVEWGGIGWGGVELGGVGFIVMGWGE